MKSECWCTRLTIVNLALVEKQKCQHRNCLQTSNFIMFRLICNYSLVTREIVHTQERQEMILPSEIKVELFTKRPPNDTS